MSGRQAIRVTWPWLLGGLAAAFAGERLAASLAGVDWIGYVVFLLIMMGMLALFIVTRSRD